MAYQTYTVRGGDSLSAISKKLGLSGWRDLYNLNKSVIGSNYNLIRPGQVLNIPGTQAAPQTAPVSNVQAQTLAQQYTDPLTGQLKSAAEIPQYQEVLPFMDAWKERLEPGAMRTGEQLLRPEVQREHNEAMRSYMAGMTGTGGERFGRALGNVGNINAASSREYQALLNDWIGQQRQGWEKLWYNPQRDIWNKGITQAKPGEVYGQDLNIPTWEDYYDKYGPAYGAGQSPELF